MLHILLVCTGNTCRSPMAEALLKAKIEKNNMQDRFAVESAGLSTLNNLPASNYAKEIIKLMGLDMDKHAARTIMPEFVDRANIILTMTYSHKMILLRGFPQDAKRIFTLTEFVGQTGDIPDPYGDNLEAYKKCAGYISKLVDATWEKIIDLAGKQCFFSENTK